MSCSRAGPGDPAVSVFWSSSTGAPKLVVRIFLFSAIVLYLLLISLSDLRPVLAGGADAVKSQPMPYVSVAPLLGHRLGSPGKVDVQVLDSAASCADEMGMRFRLASVVAAAAAQRQLYHLAQALKALEGVVDGGQACGGGGLSGPAGDLLPPRG